MSGTFRGVSTFELDIWATPIEKLRVVADAMTAEMHAGLASEGKFG